MKAGIHLKKICAIVAAVAGFFVLAAIMGLNLDAAPPLATKVVLGVSIPVFYGTSLGALPRRRRSEQWAALAENDVRRASEAWDPSALRHRRLVALGVAEEAALVLAGHPAFSVDELKSLLGKGCPVDTALRILWPD